MHALLTSRRAIRLAIAMAAAGFAGTAAAGPDGPPSRLPDSARDARTQTRSATHPSTRPQVHPRRGLFLTRYRLRNYHPPRVYRSHGMHFRRHGRHHPPVRFGHRHVDGGIPQRSQPGPRPR